MTSNKIFILALLSFWFTSSLIAQNRIKMTKKGGVFKIPCALNGLKLHLIFDTGASDVTISLSEALFMLKNGYLDKSDLEGSSYYQIANGDVVEGTTINIRELKIGEYKLENIKASIVHSMTAPLLLGQSAMAKLGNLGIDWETSELIINPVNYDKNEYRIIGDKNSMMWKYTYHQTGMLKTKMMLMLLDGELIQHGPAYHFDEYEHLVEVTWFLFGGLIGIDHEEVNHHIHLNSSMSPEKNIKGINVTYTLTDYTKLSEAEGNVILAKPLDFTKPICNQIMKHPDE